MRPANAALLSLALTSLWLPARAATISGSHIGLLAGDQNSAQNGVEVSLFDPSNSYIQANANVDGAYSAGTTTLNGIVDYHLYTTSASTPDLSLAGGTHISDAISLGTGTFRANRRNEIDYYTTKSPSGPYDSTRRGFDITGSGPLTGSIDLSGLDSNTPVDVYLIGTSWFATIDVSITPYSGGVPGTKLQDLVVNPTEGNRARAFLTHIQISDFSDIDRIDFEMEGNEVGLHAIIVTQVPEPSALLLSGLGGLLLLRRSRC